MTRRPKMPRAAGLFGRVAAAPIKRLRRAKGRHLPDIEEFEANYESELLSHASKGTNGDIAA